MRSKELQKIFKDTKMKNIDRAMTFVVKPPSMNIPGKKALGQGSKFHTFVKLKVRHLKLNGKSVTIESNSVVVVKEEGKKILGWRLYVAK